MEVPDGVPSHLELHFLLVNELNHVGVTPMKEAMMLDVHINASRGFQARLQATNTGKSAIFRFLEITLKNTIYAETLDPIVMKSFDCASRSNTFMDALVEKVHRQPPLLQDRA